MKPRHFNLRTNTNIKTKKSPPKLTLATSNFEHNDQIPAYFEGKPNNSPNSQKSQESKKSTEKTEIVQMENFSSTFAFEKDKKLLATIKPTKNINDEEDRIPSPISFNKNSETDEESPISATTTLFGSPTFFRDESQRSWSNYSLSTDVQSELESSCMSTISMSTFFENMRSNLAPEVTLKPGGFRFNNNQISRGRTTSTNTNTTTSSMSNELMNSIFTLSTILSQFGSSAITITVHLYWCTSNILRLTIPREATFNEFTTLVSFESNSQIPDDCILLYHSSRMLKLEKKLIFEEQNPAFLKYLMEQGKLLKVESEEVWRGCMVWWRDEVEVTLSTKI
ncbi:hypothetical protein G9A89_000198 [Geosiphon pyriformis]|nr:hypothetical protein G9A89_000198 [Geosiphon pyriformis]